MYKLQYFSNDKKCLVDSIMYTKKYESYNEALNAASTYSDQFNTYRVSKVEDASPVTTQTHYASLTPEPIKVIEGWGLGYVRGNAIKYLARAGKKDQTKEGTIKDLEKAISYIRREISTLQGNPSWT